jgi:hypothetical protein
MLRCCLMRSGCAGHRRTRRRHTRRRNAGNRIRRSSRGGWSRRNRNRNLRRLRCFADSGGQRLPRSRKNLAGSGRGRHRSGRDRRTARDRRSQRHGRGTARKRRPDGHRFRGRRRRFYVRFLGFLTRLLRTSGLRASGLWTRRLRTSGFRPGDFRLDDFFRRGGFLPGGRRTNGFFRRGRCRRTGGFWLRLFGASVTGHKSAHFQRDIVVERARMRFLICYAEFAKFVEDNIRFDLELASQLIDSDFAHTVTPLALTWFRQGFKRNGPRLHPDVPCSLS